MGFISLFNPDPEAPLLTPSRFLELTLEIPVWIESWIGAFKTMATTGHSSACWLSQLWRQANVPC